MVPIRRRGYRLLLEYRLFYLYLNIVHILCFVCLSAPKYNTLCAHQHTENKLKIYTRFSFFD